MKDVITRQTVVDKLAAYLHHELSLSGLVAWAETALMDSEFDGNHFGDIRDVVARVGVADVRAFGLTWEDCEHLLGRLGYSAHIQIEATRLTCSAACRGQSLGQALCPPPARLRAGALGSPTPPQGGSDEEAP